MKKCCSILITFGLIGFFDNELSSQINGPEGCETIKTSSMYNLVNYFNNLGTDICYHKWGNPEVQHYGKAILIIHGMGYHGDPFKKMMNYVEKESICVYAIDLRGHGLSGKTRGVMESNERVLSDLDHMVGIIQKENPEAQIFLVGSSSGGTYALGYLLSNEIRSVLSGAILVAPAVKVHKSQVFQISNLKLLWLWLINPSKPGIRIDGRKLEMSSRDREWIRSRRMDKLSISEISADYLRLIRKMQKTDKRKPELGSVSIPVLIQHGGKDKVVDIKGSYYLKKFLVNSGAEMIVYPESYHTLFWDDNSDQVFTDIIQWIMRN
jgi:alpha-beta hydrolase superfamily lysophospholipase